MKTPKIPLLKRLFNRKLKPYLIADKYRVVPAFSVGGEDYWYFDNTFDVPTGRMQAAMAIYQEMEMRCDAEYLKLHCKAMEKILSDPKKISIQFIAQLNINLKERVELSVPPESYVYKLASVIFFDKSESMYSYDFDYNAKKIAKWKEAGATLGFFLNTPIAELVPSLKLPERDAQIYSQVSEMISETHRRHLTDILSEKA
jgi:hypothetical protein